MPEIKVKHVVSFSSEDKVHKAENLLKPETYRKWKCATPGESKVSIVLQFEKASEIHSIDIGNEHSAFVEVLVGRSSDTSNDYQVLLVASSFMSPLESRNSTNTNRVRMFGPEKLAQNTKSQKWDCVQLVCTQPFNKNVQFGLSFVKFHSPPDPNEQAADENKDKKEAELKLGGFRLKDEDEDNSLSVGSWFSKKKEAKPTQVAGAVAIRQASSYAAAVLETKSSPPELSRQKLDLKRKHEDDNDKVQPVVPVKKKETTIAHVNREKIGYKNIDPESNSSKVATSSPKTSQFASANASTSSKNEVVNKTKKEVKKKKSFNRIMEKVVFVISGFVNPYRSEIRDRALEMGAKYKGDWDSSCTHLICAFVNTPKYISVRSKGGRIVTKDWIFDCYKKKELLPWRKYMLGKYSKSSSSEEETDLSDEEDTKAPMKVVGDKKQIGDTKIRQTNGIMDTSTSSDYGDIAIPSTSKSEKSPNKISNIPAKDKGKVEEEEDDDDTDAEIDYQANTDVDDSSGGDTEDEIRKVQEKMKNKLVKQPSPNRRSTDDISEERSSRSPKKICFSPNKDQLSPNEKQLSPKEDELSPNKEQPSPNKKQLSSKKNQLSPTKNQSSTSRSSSPSSLDKPDTTGLPLPFLPDFFKGRKFFLYGDFSEKERHDLERYITAYNGCLLEYMNSDVKYVITNSKWNEDFNDALNQNDDIIFVRSQWIFKCHEKMKCVPFQPYIVVPDD